MNKLKFFICTCFILFCSNFSELRGMKGVSLDGVNSKTNKLIVPLQNAQQLMNCIPRELQNLPYAIYPTSPEYNTARLIFNKRFVYFPKAIIIPRDFEEAQFVLAAIKKHGLTFSVRSGGHCFEPGSLSSGYVFDLSNFNSIIPDIDKEEVYIGAGCRLITIIETLGKLDFAIPSGTCPSVGIGGLALGGGIGLLTRQFGLTCDHVKSITLLNADNEIVEVNKHNFPDLFWALRGAGNGSYGIVLGYTFRMNYVPIETFYELSWEWDPKLIEPIIEAWQPWVKQLPNNISTVLGIRHPDHLCAVPHKSPPLVIRIFGLKIGPEPFTEWKSAFKNLHPKVRIITGRHVDLKKFWANESPLPFNKLKSRILMKPITQNVIRRITQFFERLEILDPNFLVYFNFEALGGVVPKGHTAFFARDAFGWWEQAYFWKEQKDDAKILALSQEFYESIPAEVSHYCYPNIVDYDLGKKYLKLYYGDHVKRLIKIKDKYDPNNLFHWKQSIPTSSELKSGKSHKF